MSKINKRTITQDEYFYGHKACSGCGAALAVRIALKVLGERAISVLPAGCMSAVGFNFPQLAFKNNSIISTFAGTGSMLSGIYEGAKSLGIEDLQIVGFAGDGATADIGFQTLSAAIDRGDDVIYICYDNEAYMNTGIQKSSLTPFGSSTTTTPAGKNIHGNTRNKKNIFDIIAAHEISYAATASVGYIQDYIDKVEKASKIRGTKYIHVLSPCPVGWGTNTDDTIDLAKEIVDNCMFPLEEYENGKYSIKEIKNRKSVHDYIRKQRRYKHLTDEEIDLIEENTIKNYENKLKRSYHD